MQMKLTHYIYISAALFLFSACQDDESIVPAFSVGETDNTIVLSAGISGASMAQTRAVEGVHVPFSNTTQMRLYVEGIWAGKTTPTIIRYTNCTTSAATSKLDGDTDAANDVHPLGSYTTNLYWDDYGTADPNNTDNRAKGLAVYGVAVEGLSTLPDNLKDISGDSWTNLAWSVNTEGSNVLQKDIVVSNNHGDNSASDKTGIKFTERNTPAKNILEYKHLMSKITFVLTPGEDFTSGFGSTPEVILTRNKAGETKTEYCNTVGTINIKSALATGTSVNTVKLQHVSTANNVVTEHALIFPGSNFGGNDADVIAKINADDNIYYVTAKQIRAALTADVNHSDMNTQSGYNYIIHVTVNKTKVVVSATIKNWVDVNAAEDLPVINISQSYGTTTGTGISTFNHSYDFFRSLNSATGYDEGDATPGIDYAARYTYTSGTGSWNKVVYWPNHNTHYFFRGVSPFIGTSSSGTASSLTEAVTTVNGNDVVAVANAAYTADTYPSDLAIALPRTTGTKCQHNKDEQSDGICATTGTVTMNFEYAMSKVQVSLKSTGTVAAGNIVDLSNDNVTVDIIDGYSKGRIKLLDGLHDIFADETDKSVNYSLHKVTTPVDGFSVSTLDAIVPQVLSDAVKFRISVTNSDSSVDVYEIQVNSISESGTSTKIGEWEHGKFYHYQLDVKKTDIKVQATLSDWTSVNAEENVWF